MSGEQLNNEGGRRNTPIFDAFHAAWAGAVLAKDTVAEADLHRQLQALSTEELVEGYTMTPDKIGKT